MATLSSPKIKRLDVPSGGAAIIHHKRIRYLATAEDVIGVLLIILETVGTNISLIFLICFIEFNVLYDEFLGLDPPLFIQFIKIRLYLTLILRVHPRNIVNIVFSFKGISLGYGAVDIVTGAGAGLWDSGLFAVTASVAHVATRKNPHNKPRKRAFVFLVFASVISCLLALGLAGLSIYSLTDLNALNDQAHPTSTFRAAFPTILALRIGSMILYLIEFGLFTASTIYSSSNACRRTSAGKEIQSVAYQVGPGLQSPPPAVYPSPRLFNGVPVQPQPGNIPVNTDLESSAAVFTHQQVTELLRAFTQQGSRPLEYFSPPGGDPVDPPPTYAQQITVDKVSVYQSEESNASSDLNEETGDFSREWHHRVVDKRKDLHRSKPHKSADTGHRDYKPTRAESVGGRRSRSYQRETNEKPVAKYARSYQEDIEKPTRHYPRRAQRDAVEEQGRRRKARHQSYEPEPVSRKYRDNHDDPVQKPTARRAKSQQRHYGEEEADMRWSQSNRREASEAPPKRSRYYRQHSPEELMSTRERHARRQVEETGRWVTRGDNYQRRNDWGQPVADYSRGYLAETDGAYDRRRRDWCLQWIVFVQTFINSNKHNFFLPLINVSYVDDYGFEFNTCDISHVYFRHFYYNKLLHQLSIFCVFLNSY